jgi:hypothetical protein
MMLGGSCRITGDAPQFPAVVREFSTNGWLMTMPCQRECSQVSDSSVDTVDDTLIGTTYENSGELPAAASLYRPLMLMAQAGRVTCVSAKPFNSPGFLSLLGQNPTILLSHLPDLPLSLDTGGLCLISPVGLFSRRNEDNPNRHLVAC